MVVYKSCSISSIILSYLTHFEAQGRKWDFLAVIFKNFLYFLKRKLLIYIRKWNFFIFQETETLRRFLIFSQKKAFFCILGTDTRKFFLHFRRNFRSPKTKISYTSQKKLGINFSKNTLGE